MPEPTPVEKEAVDNFLKKADMLTNGKRGNVDHLCEVMRDFAHLFVTSISHGGVTPAECNRTHDIMISNIEECRARQLYVLQREIEDHIDATLKRARDWKAVLAWSLPVCGSIGAIGWKLL